MDLTDQQWAIIEPLFEEKRRADGRGRPWREARDVLNGSCGHVPKADTMTRMSRSRGGRRPRRRISDEFKEGAVRRVLGQSALDRTRTSFSTERPLV
jgi:transposase